jgi:acetylornithine/N-succinyldiaminopimelate aminotransferase
MLGVRCRIPNTRLMAAMREEKLLSVTAGDNVVQLLPPLTVSEVEIREALDRLRAAASRLSEPAAAAAQ